MFAKCSREAPSGSAPGPGGCTNEMLRVCLDDGEVLQLLHLAAQDFAQGRAPAEASHVFTPASMTALQKEDGGVRGIATGTFFRRLVAKTLARQFGREVERVCAPFQFALSTRAGVDCVGHAVRAATNRDAKATVLSIDGIGAYDHVLRSAMLSKLFEEESLRGLIPFVRMVYSQPSCYNWEDGQGRRRQIRQHEGGAGGSNATPLLSRDSQLVGRSSFVVEARRVLICVLGRHLRRVRSGHALGPSMICWRRSCSRARASGCTQAKRARGTEGAKSHSAWSSWDLKSGARQG